MRETMISVRGNGYYLLGVVYFAIFFGITFTDIKSTEFMGVDEGSIIQAINGLFERPYYNMMAWYHSRAYGWSYMVLTAIFLAPFKLIFHVNDPEVINYVIKLVLFFIGLATIFALYELSRKITKNKIVSIIVATVFMLTPPVAWHLLTIHPDSTGILFFLLGSIFFIRFLEHKAPKNYLFCLVFLVLSSLAKQPFFFMALPLLLYMLLDYCNWKCAELYKFVFTIRFFKLIIGTAAVSLTIAFIINPTAFLNIKEFVAIQFGMSTYFRTKASLSDAMINWMYVALNEPIVVMHTILFFMVPILLLLKVKEVSRLFVFSVVTSTAIMLLFMAMQRMIFGSIGMANFLAIYIAPLYPVFLINISCTLLFLYKKNGKSKFRLASSVMVMVLLGYGVFIEASQTINLIAFKVMLHDQNIKYTSYNYIESLPKGSKIVHDPNVAVPSERLHETCHIWQGCGEMEYLEKFQPDYFILYKDYQYTNWEVINNYIRTHRFCITKEFLPTKEYDFDPKGGIGQLIKTFELKKNNDTLGYSFTVWARCQEGS